MREQIWEDYGQENWNERKYVKLVTVSQGLKTWYLVISTLTLG